MVALTTFDAALLIDEPLHLPYCAYPKAADVGQHGLQPLPASLPLADFARAEPHRSRRHAIARAADLAPWQLLAMARVVASSFARREPQARHLRLPTEPPAGLMQALHSDPFGTEAFGPWTNEQQMYWLIRLCMLTDPTSPLSDIRINEEILDQSLAIVDERGQVIGGAFNETMPPLDAEPQFREGDAFLAAPLTCWEAVYAQLSRQDAEALTALCAQYPAFQEAYADGKVGHHLLVARSDALAKADAFELVAASAAHYQALGYAYMVTEATNQWTGAAFETLGGVRVHFAPFQTRPAVRQSAEPLPDEVTSPNGFLSAKDSGGMFYVLRLR